ncbi:MAG: DNA replication/repair protein RecF [Sporolactobacillus sp.]
MRLESIELTQYRNYDQLVLDFPKMINLFVGKNAQGKTNLLEALYVLALAKSPRTTHDKDLIKWHEEYAKIKGRLIKESDSTALEIIVSKKGKKAKVNHLEKRRLSEYIGTMNAVMFAPEDLELVKGGPALRRRFLDMEIGQIAPIYIYSLSSYQKVLQQRNALLRTYRQQPNVALLDILTEKLIVLSADLIKRRIAFIGQLNQWAGDIHQSISQSEEVLKLSYESSVRNVSEGADSSKIVSVYENEYGRTKQREIERGMTLIGPHRDDIRFTVNDFDVQSFGSQGQQRTAALSVKLAEIELIKHEVGEYPVLLLDDVLSELDQQRRTHLLAAFKEKVQTFVTTTSLDGLAPQLIERAALYRISQGKAISVVK